ncbi:MAG TPA: acyl carrier protein [Bryobacteraceae bacterium]|nr:acyl carrier protein [Bryobacteraceae bacterium]
MRDFRAEIQQILRDVFNDETIVIDDNTTADDVEGWDSLNNIRLMVQVERKFGFRFKTSEVAGLKNVGELIKIVEQRAS